MCLLKSIAWSNVTPRSLDLGRTFALRDPKQPTTLETHTHTQLHSITFFKTFVKRQQEPWARTAMNANVFPALCILPMCKQTSLFFSFFFCHRSHFSFTWVQCWHPSLGRCWHPKGWQVFLTSSSPSSSLLSPPTPGAAWHRRHCVSSKGETAKVMPDNTEFLTVVMATWPTRTCEIH